jgi:hypothetical protein
MSFSYGISIHALLDFDFFAIGSVFEVLEIMKAFEESSICYLCL